MSIKIESITHSEDLTLPEMARVAGGDKKEPPTTKPTHIDALGGVISYGNGEKWTVALDGTWHQL